MNFLTPLGLLGLLAVPALVWLWRFASTRRQTVVSSLVPFEHLLRRSPIRRRRVHTNLLFWLQLAALLLLTAALAEPVVFGRRATTTLVIVDTSASMDAAPPGGGASAMAHAKQALARWLAGKPFGESWMLVATAPLRVLTPEPTADSSQLRALIDALDAHPVPGHLDVARRIGQAVARRAPERVLVATDEPAPEALPSGVTFETVGRALPNVAITGVDASESLCTDQTARLLVTVQNFSQAPQAVVVTASAGGRTLGRQTAELEARSRALVSFDVPEHASASVDVRLESPADALAVDNAVTVLRRSQARLPVAVASSRPELTAAVGRWLDACPRVERVDAERGEGLLLTDEPGRLERWPGNALLFGQVSDPARTLQVNTWLVEPSHPIGLYLEPLERVASSVAVDATEPGTPPEAGSAREVPEAAGRRPAELTGDPVVWGVTGGRRIPLVRAESVRGRRVVRLAMDPAAQPSSVPLVVITLNSLRWLSGAQELVPTGQALSLGGFDAGAIEVARPDGRRETRQHTGGVFLYDAAEAPGVYRFSQGPQIVERAVAFLHPEESDLEQGRLTWPEGEDDAALALADQAPVAVALRAPTLPSPTAPSARYPARSHRPLANWLLGVALWLLLAELALAGWRARRSAAPSRLNRLPTRHLIRGRDVAFAGYAHGAPLRGWRRAAALAVRVAAIAAVWMATRQMTVTRHVVRPVSVAYLLDASKSVDEEQLRWIARRVASLEARRPADLARRVLVFGAGAERVAPSGTAALDDPAQMERLIGSAAVDASLTNLEHALLAGLAELPAGEQGRVILLSDGRQTAGDVEQLLGDLRRLGLQVYPEAVPPSRLAGFRWERVVAPPIVQQGGIVPLRLVFANHAGRPQLLDIAVRLQDHVIAFESRTIAPGWRVVEVPVPAIKVGPMALEVAVRAPGAAAEQRSVLVEVEGPPRLLVVLPTPTELPALAAALKQREMMMDVTTPSELPADVGGLLRYDAVLLSDIPKSAVSQAQTDALRAYVETYGGGVLMVGLGGVLKHELETPAPLDALLPVTFEPKGAQEAKRRVCVMMLIDRSQSMLGPQMTANKRAAVELVNQLAPEDLVGVLAFDTQPVIVIEMQPAGQVKTRIIDRLVRLKAGGETDIVPAVRAAETRLNASGATVKHIILMSDGEDYRYEANEYARLLTDLREADISLSTIGIAAVPPATLLLKLMADRTGGSFYLMRDMNELPRLVAADTQKTLGRLPFSEGYFRPVRGEQAAWFAQVGDDWPSLKGYLTTTAKPGAQVELLIKQDETRDPLLAHWPLGLGRVAMFASDAAPRWSSSWIQWPAFEAVWAEAVRALMRPRASEDVFVWLETDDRPMLVIEGRLHDPQAQLIGADSGLQPLALMRTGPYRWRASVDGLPDGPYQLEVKTHAPGTAPTFIRRSVLLGRAARAPEQPHLPPDDTLLRRIAQATRGVYGAADAAFLAPVEAVPAPVPLRPWLVPLVILLLLAEIALRGRSML